MKYRLFVAINLPDQAKDALGRVADKWTELPVRWTEKNNLHITLCFLGEVDEFDITKITNQLSEAARNSKPLPIFINNISLGPNEFDPRMIWANGAVTDDFKELVKDIHGKIEKCECNENKINNFRLHITLGRFGEVTRGSRLNKIPPVREEVNISFEAESIELMESKLSPEGPSYQVLETFSLK